MSTAPVVGDVVSLAGPQGQHFINFDVNDRGTGVGIVRALNGGFVTLAELRREGWKIVAHRRPESPDLGTTEPKAKD